MIRIVLATATASLLLGCAPMDREAARQSALLDVRAVGEPMDCVATNRIRETRILNDRTIDFHLTNGDVYRNSLPYACSPLGFEERFAYKTSTGQLCSLDTITVLQSTSMPGPTCGLGPFQKIETAAR